MRLGTSLGPYYYGKYKWDNYLLDIEQTIKSGNVSGRKLQAKALDVAHQQIAEMRQHTEQLQNIEDALNEGFEALRAEFEWGFTLVVDRMDRQIEQLSEITAKLDDIHKTLQSPLLTQARELFQLGEDRRKKGLLDKALQAYLQSEQKDDVYFPLQLQIGKVYLYGRDEDDNVIDLPQAEKHLLLAARYADAEKDVLAQWNEWSGQAYFHAGIAAYLIGEQEQAVGRQDSMRSCLERALGHLNKAAILWPRFTEIIYTQAKCHALLGQIQDAAQKMQILSDKDRRYFAKASRDGDFGSFRADIEEPFKRAVISPGPLAQATQLKIDSVAEAVLWAKRSAPISKEDSAMIDSYDRELSSARESLTTLDVDIEELDQRLSRMMAELEKITQHSLQNNIAGTQQTIASIEQRKTSCEGYIEQLKQSMKNTSGAGMGWLFFVLFFLGAIMFFVNLMNVLPQNQRDFVLFVGVWGTAIGGAIIGRKIGRDSKNRPYRLQSEEHAREIDECIRKIPSLKTQEEGWKQELSRFTAWLALHPTDVNHEAASGKASGDSMIMKSPIMGTYYEARAPLAPFVRVGDQVVPGQVLCIIEAMKLMNEIEAEVAGVITAKLVENGRHVEYGQSLFAIRPAKG